MHGVNKIIAALLLMVAQSGQADQFNMPSAEKTAATSIPGCPAQDISFFIQRFSNDESVQRIFTNVPLISRQLVTEAQPEPKQITHTLQREQIAFPVMPLLQERIDSLLAIRLEAVTASTARVDLLKEDTDFLISYFFKLDDCWRLIRIENQSL